MKELSNTPVDDIIDGIGKAYLPVFDEMARQARAAEKGGILAEAWVDGAHSALMFLFFGLISGKAPTPEDCEEFYKEMAKSYEHFRIEKLFDNWKC